MKTFYNKYPEIFIPYNVEFLFDLIGMVQKNDSNMDFKKLKEITFDILKYLLDNRVLFVIDQDKIDVNKFIINKKNISTDDIIKHIDSKWNENSIFPDYYSIVFFGYEEWYVKGMVELGFNLIRKKDDIYINWEDFVEKNIGDLEKWIQENKPK